MTRLSLFLFRKICIPFMLIWLSPTVINAQDVSRIEYYFDSDPGFGNGINVAITPSTDITRSFTIDIKDLSNGFHHLYVRSFVKPYQVVINDTTITGGGWSLTASRTFYKDNFRLHLTTPNIVGAEYFLNSDPGIGKATAITINPGNNLNNISFSIDITAIPSGFHNLYMRFKDSGGNWGLTSNKRTFYKQNLFIDNHTTPDITKGEYFIDVDPGIGKAQALSVTSGNNPNSISFILDITSIPSGFHKLYTRFQDTNGKWGMTSVRIFHKQTFVSNSDALANIIKGEYFIDEDPGTGNGSNIPLTTGTNLNNLSFIADLTNITAGFHKLYTRFKDEKGKWGHTNVRTFYSDSLRIPNRLSKIIKIEYFLDKDSGPGKGKEITFSPGTDVNNISFEIESDTLSLGDHSILIRALDESGHWSFLNKNTFRMEPESGLFVTIGQIEKNLCIGSLLPIPFNASGPFIEGNVFTAQLSDKDGNFTSPRNIGTLTGKTSGTIEATVPSVSYGTNYRIRVVASSPQRISAYNNLPLTVSPVPRVFSIVGDTVTCLGTKTYSLNNHDQDTGKYAWSISGGGILDDNESSSSINWNSAGTHEITVKYSGVCAGDDSVKVLSVNVIDQNLSGEFQNLLPRNGDSDLFLPVTFSWMPLTNATYYDIFIWPDTQDKPAQPTISDITSINYTINDVKLIQNDKTYKWQVVAKRACFQLMGPIQTFSTRQLPDLVVETISAPTTATSETNITINWTVKNQGPGGTGSESWNDIVYLCDQPVLGSGTDNFYVGRPSNFSALTPGQSYQSSNISFKLPQGIQGNYYVIVQTNPSHSLKETVTTNNQLVSAPINISLAPAPDLQVTSLIVTPLSAFSEDEVTVAYDVTNMGSGPTSSTNWTDQLIISENENPDQTDGLILLNENRRQALAPNEKYSVSKKVKLPARLSGTYYMHLSTDRYSQVFEYNKEDNNHLASLPLTIIQRPTPNLIITDIAPSSVTASSGQNITLQWTTANDGALPAPVPWNESIYLSTDPTFEINKDRLLTTFARTEALQSLGSNSTQQVIPIPENIAEGDYYFFVVTDSGKRIYENPGEDDNVSPASAVVKIKNPDLRPLTFTGPSTVQSGQNVTVQWKIKNDSEAEIYNRNWTDKIYLSTDQALNLGTDILLSSIPANQFLPAGNDYNKALPVSVPANISGNYYLLLVTDANNNISEKQETNNLTSLALTIMLSPWPDLQAMSVVSPARDTVGTSIKVQYTVKNTGLGALLAGRWTDEIYLSATESVDEKTLIHLGTITQTRSLAAGESFSQNTSFWLPGSVPVGTYYAVVKTNAGNSIFENSATSNNMVVASAATNLIDLPEIDLSVTAGKVLSSAVTAGQPVSLEWTVKNNSRWATVIPSWTDALYLSADPVLSANDILLTNIAISSPLGAGDSYTRTQTVLVPQEIEGTWYFLAIADRHNQNNDENLINNILPLIIVSDGGNGETGPTIPIVTPPPADLTLSSFTIPAQGTASQPVLVNFKVKNNGTGPTPSNAWTDQLYLSTDSQIGGDFVLGSFPHSSLLESGAEYTVSQEVFLPANASGNYFVILKTDANNSVFERGQENNNIRLATILISSQQASDLIVEQVDLLAGESYAGEPINIGWTLANRGTNPASGFMREAAYLSANDTLDINDVLLGTLEASIFLPSQVTAKRSLQKPLINLAAGDYYVIIKTDILDNILEMNDGNNQAVSATKLSIAVKPLPLNVLTETQLPNNSPIYYRIEIPDSLANETLSVTLNGESSDNAVSRLFIRKGYVPNVNEYDYVAHVPFQTNQEVIVPSLKPGTYYLMSLGSSSLKINLLAKIIPFGIKSVEASTGGNTGLATVKITGAQFEPNTIFRLRRSASDFIQAIRVRYINQTLAYATFDLTNKPLGLYDVEAARAGGLTTKLPQSFTIQMGPGNNFISSGNGGPGNGTGFVCSISNVGFEDQLTTDVLTPASARLSVITSFTINYQNTGTVDIPVPTKFLVSLNENVPIGFTALELKENKKDLILECKEMNGPPDILRPGAGGFFKIYTVSNNRTVPSIDLTITD